MAKRSYASNQRRLWCPFERRWRNMLVSGFSGLSMHRVSCCGCDALGPPAKTKRGAVRRWNLCLGEPREGGGKRRAT